MDEKTREGDDCVRRCLTAIGYPAEEISAVLSSSLFAVDGLAMRVVGEPGGVRFEFPLGGVDAAALVRLGSFASGRLTRDDAVFAFDPVEGSAFIWQRVARVDDDREIRHAFEGFAVSAEWWHDRCESASSSDDIPEMVIRP